MLVLAVAVAVSIVGLAIGPGLVALGRGRAVPSAAIEGLTLGMVPALIAVRILPHVHASLGGWSVVLTALGYGGLWLADRRGHRGGAKVGHAVIVPALALHALTDGAALAVAASALARGASSGLLLGAVLLLHRLPEGLFLATTLVPIVGWRGTLKRLGLVAGATVLGAVLGGVLLDSISDALVDGVVALGLGAMLRLALHTHSPAPTERASRAASGAAFVLGVTVALAVPVADDVLRRAQPSELSVIQTLIGLFVETAPVLLGGLLCSALLRTVLPRRPSAWLRGGPTWVRALRGVAFGAGRTWCACGVLPMGRRMLAEGITPAAVFAFVVTAPVLAFDALALPARLLGVPAALFVAVAAVLMAVAATRTMSAFAEPVNKAKRRAVTLHVVPDDDPPIPDAFGARLQLALRETFATALDESGAWYASGLLAAAALEAASRWHFAASFGSPLDVIVISLLAAPLTLASQGVAPVAATLVHKGCSVGAAVSLLLIGPGLSMAAIATVRRLIGVRAGAVFALAVVVLGAMLGVLANVVVPAASVPAMHALASHHHAMWERVAAMGLALALVTSLLRVGPREWFGNMTVGGDEREIGEHDHGHAHGHDHPPNEEPPYPAGARESKG